MGSTHDCIFLQGNGKACPLTVDDIAALRRDPILAAHLPSEAGLLAAPEAACKAGDAAACLVEAEAWQRVIGKRDYRLCPRAARLPGVGGAM